MARLPQPGGDSGNWGSILNDYLSQSHTSDGSIKNDIVTAARLSPAARSSLSKADSAYQLPAEGVPLADMNKTELDAAYAPAAIAPGNDAQAVGKGELVVNVKDFGALGDGTANDTASIQAAINASPTGAVLYFPAGVYMISATLLLKSRRTYRGPGTSTAGDAIIRQIPGTNLSAPLMAAEVWASATATGCDEPITVRDLQIDGNRGANSGSTSGLLLINYWSHVSRVCVFNCSDAAITLTDRKSNGLDITNSCSENRVTECKINNCGRGIVQESYNGISNQDGYCENNLISEISDGPAIDFARAAGWSFMRNHTYGVSSASAVVLWGCFSTVITNNYIEEFGADGPGWFSGIEVHVLNDWGTTITGNMVAVYEHPGANENRGYSISAQGGQANARVVFTGNHAHGYGGDNARGFVADAQNGGALYLSTAANNFSAFGLSDYLASEVTTV